MIHIYTGDGKGKTSAALGLALRALGRGLTVHMVRFIKGKVDYGEAVVAKNLLGFEMVSFGKGSFIEGGSPTPEDIEQARKALDHVRNIFEKDGYDIIILDEINVAISLGLIETQDILRLIDLKPDGIELVLTGRGAPNEIVEAADLVTEMKEIKHPFNKGIEARKGIEY